MAYSGGRSFMDIGQQFQSNAINARSGMRPSREDETKKTVGGALMSGAGMAAAGGSVGASMGAGAAEGSSAGLWGAGIGAVVGIAAYLLS